jgi:starch synthase
MPNIKVLFATSELAPWVKTGGLADVAAALPDAVHAKGIDARILVPSYPALKAAFPHAPMVAAIPPLTGQLYGAAVREVRTASGVTLYLLECDAYFDRPGNPYLGPDGHDWPDNGLRFGLLSRVAALLADDYSPLNWRPDILHCSDWQTGLGPVFLRHRPYHVGKAARTVITIHNLAFQGLFGRDLLPALGLPAHAWSMHGVEYHGYLSFLKGGLQYADAITTVSPTYAREIQTEAEGMGMDALLRERAGVLTGILNGIDMAAWNPATDPHIAAHYDAKQLTSKAANTRALREEMGLAADTERPLIGIVSRLTHQKGLDLVPPLLYWLATEAYPVPAQFAVLGSGDKGLEAAYRELEARFPGQFAVRFRFDEGLAHRIEAGSDMFLMPSRFEPCGLNQMYSLRYGTPPIVRATGGLADTVVDASHGKHGTGFVFQNASIEALHETFHRAMATWHDHKGFAALQRRAMSADFSWDAPADAYIRLYRSLLQ